MRNTLCNIFSWVCKQDPSKERSECWKKRNGKQTMRNMEKKRGRKNEWKQSRKSQWNQNELVCLFVRALNRPDNSLSSSCTGSFDNNIIDTNTFFCGWLITFLPFFQLQEYTRAHNTYSIHFHCSWSCTVNIPKWIAYSWLWNRWCQNSKWETVMVCVLLVGTAMP